MDNLQIEDLEEGMSYYIHQRGGNKYVFKYLDRDPDNKENILASAVVAVNNSFFKNTPNVGVKGIRVNVEGFAFRKATVEEDVMLQESIRIGARLTVDEAVSMFEERYK